MSADPASVEPTPDAPSAPPKSESVLRRRFRRFRSIRRGWFSFIVLFSLYGLSFFSHLLVSEKALVVKYDGELHFPAFGNFHEAKEFGQRRIGEANYRLLDRTLAEDDDPDTWVLMPIYEFGPIENLLEELDGPPPHKPSAQHWLGTDNRGRDVFSRLVYGFWYSLTFGLGVVGISYLLGVAVGSVFGFFGGRVDIYGQRLVEIWASLPFLYTVMIISNILQPSLGLLVFLVAIFSWVGISFYMRGEFYREKARDYVSAAIAQGESRTSIMFSHILPNALTPIISFAPFALVGAMNSIVALDFLGLGLPAPTPSWGELMSQGLDSLTAGDYHLVVSPIGALLLTLLMVVFIGEAIREAFDPKVFSRLR
jgi:microcin C transport system permease protein